MPVFRCDLQPHELRSGQPRETGIGRNLTDSERQVCSCVLEGLSVSLGLLWDHFMEQLVVT